MSKIFPEATGRLVNNKTVTDTTEKDYSIQFVTHMGGKWCGCKKARLTWSKIIEVVSYWKPLPKNKHLWLGKHGANTRYDHLCKILKDGLVSAKLLFFEEATKKLNEFLPIFQTDKSMAPFLTKTLEDHIKTLVEIHSQRPCRQVMFRKGKIRFQNINNQKPTHLVDLGFAVNHEIQLLKNSKKISDSQIMKFKKKLWAF